MADVLQVKAGQHTNAGIKPHNEDSCGIYIAKGASLTHKGIVAVTADGVGSSEAGREASEHCVKAFIDDYLSTPMSWSVHTSGERIIKSLNSWLYNQGQARYASELSLATTLAILILKSTTAHVFHVGDSRVYHIRNGNIKRLTKDHRLVIDKNKSYLARAMGGEHDVHFDYTKLLLEVDDTFVLTTDGVHEFIDDATIMKLAGEDDAEAAAQQIVKAALAAGSDDNLTAQVLRITQLPNQDENEYYKKLTSLPFPPPLEAGQELDGYKIIKELHASNTIQVYLAEDIESGDTVVLKTPSINFEDDPVYIDKFLHEVWVGRRIDNPHVFKVLQLKRERSCIYYVTEYLEGQSLAQWILDHPKPDLEKVRNMISQMIKGLRAFHRKEMVHRDIKPENIMVDQHGMIKIIDFGSVRVSGLEEIHTPIQQSQIEGTANYIAPELFDGYEATPKSDMYALGVTIYEMLSGGHFPYGKLEEAKPHKHYDYISIRKYNDDVPVWMDRAIQKAVSKNPERRYDSFSEFEHDLSNPNPEFMKAGVPLIERNPIGFWKGLAVISILLNVILILTLAK